MALHKNNSNFKNLTFLFVKQDRLLKSSQICFLFLTERDPRTCFVDTARYGGMGEQSALPPVVRNVNWRHREAIVIPHPPSSFQTHTNTLQHTPSPLNPPLQNCRNSQTHARRIIHRHACAWNKPLHSLTGQRKLLCCQSFLKVTLDLFYIYKNTKIASLVSFVCLVCIHSC